MSARSEPIEARRLEKSEIPVRFFCRERGASPPRYSVLLPCVDEEEALAALAPRLQALRESLGPRGGMELVLIDDGSQDATVRVATSLFGDYDFFTVARHQRNLGLGAAIATGIGVARGEVICTLDADGTYDPLLIIQLIDALEDGSDVVTASPYHPEGSVEGSTRWRLFLSRSLSRFYSWVLGSSLYTYTACMRAYRADVARRYRPTRNQFDAVAEMIIAPLTEGRKVREIPAHLGVRRHGRSKLQLSREIRHHLRMLFRLLRARWSVRRNHGR